jgi:hypothetical protein
MFTYYKNDSVRKLVVGFGNLFSGIQIEQINADSSKRTFNVPLFYASKEKFIMRLTQHSSISENTRIEIGVPQMSFELVGLVYDPLRRMNKLSQKTSYSSNTISSAYTETPYNFTFNLYVYARNIEENLQILEQILPYFSPEFIISLNMTNIHQAVDVPIVLSQTNLSQDYEGDFSTRRNLLTTYQFTAKSYVYGNIVNNGVPTSNVVINTSDNPFTFTNSFGLTA